MTLGDSSASQREGCCLVQAEARVGLGTSVYAGDFLFDSQSIKKKKESQMADPGNIPSSGRN